MTKWKKIGIILSSERKLLDDEYKEYFDKKSNYKTSGIIKLKGGIDKYLKILSIALVVFIVVVVCGIVPIVVVVIAKRANKSKSYQTETEAEYPIQ